MYKSICFFLVVLLLVMGGIHAQQLTWKGVWITNTEDTTAGPAPYFRKVFRTDKTIQKAVAYVCGVGYHIVYLNGQPVTNAVLEQGYTRYDKRLLFNTYDVTTLLSSGNNCLAVALGNGWYNVQSYTIWFFDRIAWRKTPRLLLNLVVEYTDGTSDTIATDSSWKCTTGPSQFNSMHAGEIYDARKEIPHWNTSAFDDSQWPAAKATRPPGGALYPQEMPSIKVIRHITPVTVKPLGNGRWLYDMGQNFAGVVTLRVQGQAGDSVILRHGEVLTATGVLDRMHNASQMLDTMGPRFQTDIYILKGGGPETFTPNFTYHGFQYVEVQTSPAIQLSLHSLEGLFYSTDFATAGTFHSSDTMLNKLYAAALQSYRSNFVGNPTDCPQREKMGWTADTHIATEMGLWNFNSASGYRKWLRDLRDVQLADGNLPGIAPTNGRGYHWTDANDDGFGPAWGSALPLVTWYLYLYEGDTTIVQENYAAIQLYMQRLRSRAQDYIYPTGFGDWLALQETPVPFLSTAYFYTDARLLSRMATILGHTAEAGNYARLADSIQAAFNRKYFDSAKGLYTATTVAALSAALYHGLCPEQYRPQVAAQLAAAVQQRQYHCDFGVLGSKYILNALSDAGYATIAYKMLIDTGYAGWGHWIAQGATTLYEDWKGEFSRNHVYAGDYAAWYFKSLAGIRPDEQAPGFRHFTIHPVFPDGLEGIAVTHTTRYGTIALDWKRKGASVQLTITVPPHTTASLTIPGYQRTLKAGKHTLTVQPKGAAASPVITKKL